MTGNTYDSWGSSAERFADGSICLGIDLGTTNSCVGMWHVDRNHVKILKNRLDRGRTTPSVVRFNPQSQSLDVGNVAVGLETSDPVGNTIRSVKRLMGQKFDSKAADVARIYAAYEVAPTAQGNVAVQVVRSQKKVQVQPEEVSACVLTELKASAEAYFDGQTKLDNVVITVPAYFSDSQRKATITSASMAGFKTIRLLNEPTAAAMAYGLFLSGTKLVTVFDFGGGTLDVSLLRIEDGKFEVLGIGGDTNLGGEDINNILVDHLLEVLYKHHDVTRAQVIEGDMVRLKREVEKAKIELSEEEYAEITVHDIANVPKFTYTLMRHKFEQLCEPIWKKCLRIVSNVLKEAEVEAGDIDEVILVGGSTRIPILRTKISEAFDGKVR
ncbi:Heat shock protein70 [Phytophthora megakarya]|uniref:Heat shock protein70 n=1 Tax=Phytophthora megakarya TaxID=4795 RepID=A0A225UPR9_9STRA|nr:Heat shock protein70 [Phytophthora megakarya]